MKPKPKCPNCGSTGVSSGFCLLQMLGVLMGFVGLIIWPLLLIAIPMIFIGPIGALLEKTGKFKVHYFCSNCKSRFELNPEDFKAKK